MALAPIRYVDYASWQQARERDGGYAPALAYWRERLADLPAPVDLPTDRPRPPLRDLAGHTVHLDLPPEVAARVSALSRTEGATPYISLLTVFAALLYRYTGQTDLLIGSSVSGRTRPELSALLGMLVNLVPVRVAVDGGHSFRDTLGQARERVAEALAHQDLPYDALIRDLRPGLPRNRPPLVQVGFNMPYDTTAAALGPLALPITPQGSQLDLTVHVVPALGGVLRIEMEYSTALFDQDTVERLLADYARLLDTFTAEPGLPLSGPVLADPPVAAAPMVGSELLPELVAAQALRTPDACAVLAGEQRVSYADLRARADLLARRLRANGVAVETPVGVYLGRGIDAVVALLAVWQAGGCYVPLDPEHPAERTAAIVADAAIRTAVTTTAHADRLAAHVATVLSVDAADATADGGDSGGWQESADGNDVTGLGKPVRVRPDQAAYILHTSGSTGRPKGVVITHAGIANRVLLPIRQHGLGPGDRVLHKTALTFDAAGWEIFSPLVCGGTVAIAAPGVERDPAAVLAAVADTGATVLQVVPSLLRELVRAPGWADTATLRLLMCAGEPLSGELCDALRRLSPARVVNTYGPTECSIDITAHEWPPEQTAGPVPIGHPIDGMRALVLDRDGLVAPVGVTGELYAGGVGVARGYLDRPDLTADRFVPDPFGPPGSRLYRTGDLVRADRDGSLVFLGRRDSQVKVNGVRVEPAEIEQALLRHPDVRAAAVVARASADGGRQLVGYACVVGETTTAELRAHLHRLLPAPMVPGLLVLLDRLPVTTSGKVDRGALAQLAAPAPDTGDEPPADGYEKLVAAAWVELLDIDRFGVTDDFFALGGHSLQLARLATLLRERSGRPVSLTELYTTTTVRAQALLLHRPSEVDSTIAVLPRDGRLTLSAGQRRMWFLEQLEPGLLSHTVPVVVPLPADARAEEASAALALVADRHEILRTRYLADAGEPYQVIDAHLTPEVSTGRVFGGALDALGEALPRLAAEPFDLAAGPVLRCRLVHTATAGPLLVVLFHHIAWDGGSLAVFTDELQHAYRTVRGLPTRPARAALPVQYADYAGWQRARLAAAGADDLAYWRARLAGARATALPPDLPRPPVWTGRGNTFAFAIDAATAAAARAAGRAQAATPFMTMLTAFQSALVRVVGETDIVIGTPVAARTTGQTDDLIGYFANTVVLRTDLSGDPDAAQALARTREVTLAAYRHQETPFDDVVDALRPPRDPSRTPLFAIMFELADRLPYLPEPADGLDPATLHLDWPGATYELTVSLVDRPDGGYLALAEYACDLFHRDTVQAVVDAFRTEVAALAATAGGSAPDAGSVPADHPVLGRQVADDPAPVRTLADVLHRQARDQGHLPAVCSADGELSYAELDERVTALAGALVAAGAAPAAPVAVCLPRSGDLVVAALAVMRAGGCHAPLDADAPIARIAGMLAATGTRLLVSDAATVARLAPTGALTGIDVVYPDAAGPDGTVEPAPMVAGSPAYLVHTSGSTGQPKGVVVDHARYLAHCRAMVDAYGVGPGDRLLMTCPPFVDVAMENIGVAVAAGATVVVGEAGPWSPRALPDLIARERIAVIDIPPAALRDMLDVVGMRDPRLATLRLVNVGTDVVYAGDVQRLAALELPARCVASYGPTEAVITASLYPLTPADLTGLDPASALAIGRPTAGHAAYVLDAQLAAVPDGEIGELVLGGDALADGYHRQPALTAERFVPDPFAARPGARMYRTGDRVARRPDGILDFHGRADRQVKINSFRVELGEVEARLRGHRQLLDAAVVAVRRDDLTQLAAYVVPAGPVPPDAAELRRYLRERLPAHMVPVHWTVLAALPTGVTGKLDLSALPPPLTAPPTAPPTATAARTAVADGAPTAGDDGSGAPLAAVLAVWQAVLGVTGIGPDDEFFDLGGNSMAAIRVHARIRDTLDVDLPLRAMFEATTPAALARAILDEIVREVAELSDEQLLALAPPADQPTDAPPAVHTSH